MEFNDYNWVKLLRDANDARVKSQIALERHITQTAMSLELLRRSRENTTSWSHALNWKLTLNSDEESIQFKPGLTREERRKAVSDALEFYESMNA